MDGNSKYAKIAVSDGTFGPRGTVFCQTWSNAKRADEVGYLPGGGTWRLPGGTLFGHGGYGAAVAVRAGRLCTGSSDEGVTRYAIGTAINSTLYAQGEYEYKHKHLQLLYGHTGISPYGYPAPRGISAAVDYYLDVNGS
jgi:hypothetical protein